MANAREALPAGRELDALVAERVMGWTVEHFSQFDQWSDADGWIYGSQPPPYSTDIAAAWQVIEHIAQLWTGTDDCGRYRRFRESIHEQALGEPFLNCSAEQMALVICRAALATLPASPKVAKQNA